MTPLRGLAEIVHLFYIVLGSYTGIQKLATGRIPFYRLYFCYSFHFSVAMHRMKE